MKRQIIYPGAIPLETDLLNTNKNTMVALGKLVAATFGTSTFANGLGCAPNAPAALNVVISPGEIYSLQNIDGTAYSSIVADTTHQIMKQGISLDAVTLACAAPGTAGQSINYLIQAAFSEVDSTPVVLPYYNASNPSQAYSGPANAGTTNNTARDGQVVLSAKAGVAATTGSQITPAADSGYVGLWVVTVANGQATIVAGNIAQAAGAPFVGTAALLNVLNAFTVSPTAPTPAQFDNSTKLATTAFLKSAGVQHPGPVVYSGTGALVASAVLGNLVIAYGQAGPVTFTLPASPACQNGSTISFFNSGIYDVTILRNGADFINPGGVNITSVVLKPGDTLSISLLLGSATWEVFGGSAQLAYLPIFALGTGYQKLPSGLIIQWGGTAASSASADITTAFPITFPVACQSVVLSANVAGGGLMSNYASFSASSFSSSVWNTATTRSAGIGCSYIAIGK